MDRDGAGAIQEVEYKFTLVDLNERSYYLIHMAALTAHASGQPGPASHMVRFMDALRAAVLLANLEVCMIRCWQLADKDRRGQEPSPQPVSSRDLSHKDLRNGEPNFLVDLARPSPLEEAAPRNVVADEQRRKDNEAALAPVAALLDVPGRGLCSRHAVRDLLRAKIDEVGKLADQPEFREALHSATDVTLAELAFTFAAYQPAVLDEDIKGSQSPYDPRSHTKSMKEVKRGVDKSLNTASTDTPNDLANLGMKLLKAVATVRSDSMCHKFTARLLQSACMSGQCELVEAILDNGLGKLSETEIIRRLCSAWAGYRLGKLLHPRAGGAGGDRGDGNGGIGHGHSANRGAKEEQQSLDWLDFKYSCARAVVIAYKVMETVRTHTEKELGQSLQCSYAQRGTSAMPQPVPLSEGTAGESPAAAAAARSSQNGALAADAGASAAASVSRQRAFVAGQPEESPQEPEPELTQKKWHHVQGLFKVRPAACKPLALAILHVVLAEKREMNKQRRKDAKEAEKMEKENERLKELERQQSMLVAGVPPGDGHLRSGGSSSDGEEDDEDGEAKDAEEQERERQAEEDRKKRYKQLHRLAVQACHLAVHAGSLSTVSDAISCIRAVRAWPAIDLEMLNDLAEVFPHQCVQLLEMVPLEVVELEDNVLPFALPAGFVTVAASSKDGEQFGQGSGSGSTQDATHFATQREEDVSIEASLLIQGRTWLSLLFLFWPSERRNPTTRKLLRVAGCALSAFLWQGPGSCAVAVAFLFLLAVLAVLSRVLVTVFRLVFLGIFGRLGQLVLSYFPGLQTAVARVRGRQGSTAVSTLGGGSMRITPAMPAATNGDVGREGRDSSDSGSDSDSDDGIGAALGRGLWQGFFAHGHNAIIDRALGWGKGSASVSCRKVPIAIPYAPPAEGSPDATLPKRSRTTDTRTTTGRGSASSGNAAASHKPRHNHRQLDTLLLEKLLRAPGVRPSVFGSKVLRPMILFKWNYFTKYFIILQFLLHVTYMGIFLAYAFSIKDMEPVDGRESGPGANTPGCQLQAPTTSQTALLVVLAVMTVDFLIQEVRQIYHFRWHFLTHTWDLLDVASVALVVASIVLHFSCTSNISPLTLRGLAAVQIILLFMRLLYYAMASDKLGSFVRMVLETTYDLMMFFAFLAVVFVGFALAMIVSQGALADEEQTFIKLFTMMYGDFDVSYLSTLDSGALGLDALTRVLASLYMIMVTIILLNLLISIISESYERIRENERWESLRNKALLVVESETQLYQRFLVWLYSRLTASSGSPQPKDDGDSPQPKDDGKRFLYVIAPEFARRNDPAGDDDDDDDEADDGDDEDDDDGQWNGRLGEMKKCIQAQGRATLDGVRKELEKKLGGGTGGSGTAGAAGDKQEVPASRASSVSGGEAGVLLSEEAVRMISEQVGVLVRQEVGSLRQELLAAQQRRPAQQPRAQGQQQPQPHTGRPRLEPLPGRAGDGRLAGPAGDTQQRPETS